MAARLLALAASVALLGVCLADVTQPEDATALPQMAVSGTVNVPSSACYPTCAVPLSTPCVDCGGSSNSNEEMNLIKKVQRGEKRLERKVKKLTRGLHRSDRDNARLRHETRKLQGQVAKNSQLHKVVNSIRRNIASVRKARGPRGPSGKRGKTGKRGPRGRTGKPGHTGPRGAKGAPGSTGARGAPGAQGATGPTGAKGSTGAQGAQGRRGPAGPRGATGRQGRHGATGHAGRPGKRGPRGFTGHKGKRGIRGPRGSRGPRGARGARGLRGHRGSRGSRGPRGPRGSRGARGVVRHVHHHIHHRPKPKKRVHRPPAGHGCRAARRTVRKQILVCGGCGAWRQLHQYMLNRYLKRYGIRISRGCNPTSRTQAMFVTRSGSPRRSWSNYVSRGGLIITEWSMSARAYNAVFGHGARRAARMQGTCSDRVMPAYQKSKRDPFWKVNHYHKERRPGCGYNMAGYPGITCLGGWNSRTCSFGYKCKGSGRLWLVEADWQDGEMHRGGSNWLVAGRLFASMALNGAKV